MKSKLYPASAIAVAATLSAALLSAQGSGAAAQATNPELVKLEPSRTVSRPVVQPLPDEAQPDTAVSADATISDAVSTDADAPAASSLADMVVTRAQTENLSPELRCLAGAIYFEAKSESLPGQLAVGRVVVNRSKSGRFPASYCGVVYQPSQFSFIRGRSMPAINTGSQDWREAVAIARIADAGAWRSPAEGALFFHAARVSPGWRLTRVARVDNHVFYR
jgi:spore germination cell wall hydrolase CwlJ-like protein